MNTVLTISEAAKELGVSKNRKLVRSLIDYHEIPTQKVGASVVIDGKGFNRLKAAYKAWKDRPIVSRPRHAVAN